MKIKQNSHTFRVIIEPDGKYFHAYVPALRGCHSHGKSISEAKKNIKGAIELHVEEMIDFGEQVPDDRSFESFETVSIGRVGAYA